MKDLNSKTEEVKKEEILLSDESQPLNVEELLKVEGGDDNDEDDCLTGQCWKGSKTCYTGA